MNVVSYRSPSPEESESSQVTRKRTWKTTTRETTTSVKQETRTELETLQSEKPEATSKYVTYNESGGKQSRSIRFIN